MVKTRIGIIVALQMELENIENAMTEKSVVELSGMKFIVGTLAGKQVVAALCGVGKVFAAICTQTMILGFAPEVIVNAGVAGSLSQDITIGDLVIANDAVQHDMDTTALGDEIGLISGLNIVHIPADKKVTKALSDAAAGVGLKSKTGTIATGDCFIGSDQKKKYIADTFGASACDMESAAVIQSCYVNKVPCSVLRAISDGGDDNSAMDYNTFAKQAADNSAKVIETFVRDWA